MRVTVLGSGTCVPKKDYASPGYLVEGQGLKILMDCGSGSLQQMARAGHSYKEIDLVLLSHLHLDHFLDFLALTQALLYTPGYTREKDLYVIVPAGGKEIVENLLDRFNFWPPAGSFDLAIFDVSKKINFQEKLKIEAQINTHDEMSVSYKISDSESTFFYSGDTGEDPGLASLARGSQVMIVECSYPFEKTEGHLALPQAMELIGKVNPRGAVLTHFYYPREKYDIEKYRGNYQGRVVLAEDLMVLEI